jgi:hypothetical protein
MKIVLCHAENMRKFTLVAAKKKFGSLYNVAKQLGLAPSTVTRWGKFVPDDYTAKLIELPPSNLKRGGKRNA